MRHFHRTYGSAPYADERLTPVPTRTKVPRPAGGAHPVSCAAVAARAIGSRTKVLGMRTPTMRAWVVGEPGPIDEHPLQLVERGIPNPGPGQIRIRVHTCGVCRTDLHLAEGDLAPRRAQVTPGHEVVGVVERAGPGSDRFAEGDRVGVPWLAHTCGVCRFCTSGRREPVRRTPFHRVGRRRRLRRVSVAEQDYVYALPRRRRRRAAPLLCAGIIGYRALRRARCPPAVGSASTGSVRRRISSPRSRSPKACGCTS